MMTSIIFSPMLASELKQKRATDPEIKHGIYKIV